jgi:hypothetical protein
MAIRRPPTAKVKTHVRACYTSSGSRYEPRPAPLSPKLRLVRPVIQGLTWVSVGLAGRCSGYFRVSGIGMPMRSKPSRWVLIGSVSIAVVPVPGGQPGLDRVLPAGQPVHRRVDVIGRCPGHAQVGLSVVSSHQPGGGRLGGRRNAPGDNGRLRHYRDAGGTHVRTAGRPHPHLRPVRGRDPGLRRAGGQARRPADPEPAAKPAPAAIGADAKTP